ncbi:MAG: ACP S-malonyltransferase [Rickettsiales bacterium]|jgi:[acyl-carrier-protein] S-malonyltransferase|nr:ACP S-malonyltransferase [Rickettsiales bacterium]
MSKMLVFPGQGSQFVGMGKDLADKFDVAKNVFAEVDDALGQDLSKIMFDGSMEELTLTANSQPAIMAVSIAVLKVWMNLSGRTIRDAFAYVAGHSLGEYTALCAAGSLSLHDTAKLLRLRGEAMQRAVPVGQGAMAVLLGLDIESVQKICRASSDLDFGVCDLANDNAPGQVVVSGSKPAVDKAIELAKEAGAKRAMLLPLSVPPHSSLMENARMEMEAALADIVLVPPIVPMISNRTAQPVFNSEEIKNLLVQQMVKGVRWRETILNAAELGVDEVVEFGPGKVLTGLAPRISEGMKAEAVGTPDDIKNFIGEQNV